MRWTPRWRESAAASAYTSSASGRCRGPAPRQPQRLRWSSRTGRVVDVASEQTVLDAVRAAGVNAPSSCEMGICGTCETKVPSGLVDHRDEPLTDEEQAAGTTMMICVSRAACPRLVLDL